MIDKELELRCRKFTIKKYQEAIMNAYRVFPLIPLMLLFIYFIFPIWKLLIGCFFNDVKIENEAKRGV